MSFSPLLFNTILEDFISTLRKKKKGKKIRNKRKLSLFTNYIVVNVKNPRKFPKKKKSELLEYVNLTMLQDGKIQNQYLKNNLFSYMLTNNWKTKISNV